MFANDPAAARVYSLCFAKRMNIEDILKPMNIDIDDVLKP